jgi:hypothetical protein
VFKFFSYKELLNVLSFLLPTFKDLAWQNQTAARLPEAKNIVERFIVNSVNITPISNPDIPGFKRTRDFLPNVMQCTLQARTDFAGADLNDPDKKNTVYSLHGLILGFVNGNETLDIPELPIEVKTDIIDTLSKIAVNDPTMLEYIKLIQAAPPEVYTSSYYNYINKKYKNQTMIALDILKQILDHHINLADITTGRPPNPQFRTDTRSSENTGFKIENLPESIRPKYANLKMNLLRFQAELDKPQSDVDTIITIQRLVKSLIDETAKELAAYRRVGQFPEKLKIDSKQYLGGGSGYGRGARHENIDNSIYKLYSSSQDKSKISTLMDALRNGFTQDTANAVGVQMFIDFMKIVYESDLKVFTNMVEKNLNA